ncbi:MAG: hypothetical protein ABI330_11005 [Caldimonas sp.]
MTDSGGDPVVQLQTNFGGGKTHSMLALYHLFSGAASELLGVEELMQQAGVTKLVKAKRVVFVGNKISPGNPSVKADGTIVRTLWDELARQLGGKPAYARVAADDERATNPGDVLRELFNEYGPSIVWRRNLKSRQVLANAVWLLLWILDRANRPTDPANTA